MIWQDVALACLQAGLSVALVPAVLARVKPDRLTCALNAVLLYCMAGVLATLGLALSPALTACVATLWAVLLVQRRA